MFAWISRLLRRIAGFFRRAPPDRYTPYSEEPRERRRSRANRRYMQARWHDPALAALNSEQREAVLVDDDRHLVVAGAGSGKTLLLADKVRDLIRHGGVAPAEVAVATFTRKAAGELHERVDAPEAEIGTLHHLARQVVQRLTGESVRLSPFAEDVRLRLRAFSNWIEKLVLEDRSLLMDLALRQAVLRDVQTPPGEQRTSGTDAKVRYRVPPFQVATYVRSYGEAQIAVALWLMRVPYRYEENFPLLEEDRDGGGKDYRPDFFIPDDPKAPSPPAAGDGVWLEHYGYDRNGALNPSDLDKDPEAHDRYKRTTDWKRNLHKRRGTRYVETSYADIQQCGTPEAFAELLAERIRPLLGRKIEFPGPEAMGEALQALKLGSGDTVNALALEVDEWCRSIRQRAAFPEDISGRLIREHGHTHALAMIRIAEAVRERYERELERTGTQDHEGTILQALELVNRRGRELPWRRLLVDEWQDVNPAQSALVHALAREAGARLTCVGDPWQSIYSFQGGDVALIHDFRDPADRPSAPAVRTGLTRTYRHGQELADLTRAFITAKGSELDREVFGEGAKPAHPEFPKRVQLGSLDPVRWETPQHGHPPTEAILRTLKRCAEYPEARSVLILGRRNADIFDFAGSTEKQAERILAGWHRDPSRLPRRLRLAPAEEIEKHARKIARRASGFVHASVQEQAEALGLSVRFMTIHGAKGLEDDLVILLDGAPVRVSPERSWEGRGEMRQLLQRPAFDADGEERRIWYVALTRARQGAFVLVPGKHGEHSQFADELIVNMESGGWQVGADMLSGLTRRARPTVPCPACGSKGRTTMALRLAEGSRGIFVGCTSYSWGQLHRCGHTENACGACGEGILDRLPPRPGEEPAAKCQNEECGTEAPLCACPVPKPMTARRNGNDGSRLYVCQDHSRRGGCGRTVNVAPRIGG